ncbi:MAG: SoxR reducing system RseC family protein [Firmicutes bacterium]|nr:SoxR reducing system RseC family protein [Bacillota bacterium]
MAEIGKVIEIENNKAVVSLERKEACAKCRACSAGMKAEEMLIRAENICGAKIGDKVEIALEETDFIKAVLIMYGFPFVMFMVGLLGGYYGCLNAGVQNPELIGFAAGIVLVVVSYALIKSQEKRWRSGNYVPKAIAVRNDL